MAPRDGSIYRPWPRYSRTLEGAWYAIEDLREQLDRMDRADEIAERVTAQMKRDTALGLTILQKALVAGVAMVSLAGSIAAIVKAFTG